MDPIRAIEREEQLIEDAVDAGEMSEEEAREELRELDRSYRAEAEEEAQRAYEDRMRDFF